MPPSPSTETEEDPYLKHDPYYVQAVEWLESPSLLYNLQEAISRREAQQDYLVGEEDNAIQLLFDVIQKQSVEVRGESGGGKNTLCDRVLSIVPPEWYRKIGGLTDKSLRYLEPSVRILYIAERRGLGLGDLESTPEYDMKVSISEGELTYLEVVRDKESGEQKTVERTVRVGQFITTSTEPAFAQLENRVDVIQIRDDVAQNEKVRDEQLRKAGTFPWDAKSYDEQVKVAQYCVRMVDRETGGLDVLIPFGDCLKPILRTEATSVRRNGLKILNMVEACAKVHYRQRPRVKSRGQEVIVACPLDLMIVLNIAGRNLEQMLSEATPKMVSVFELAREVDGRKDKITTPTLLALAREKKLSQLGRRSIQDTVRTLTERGILR
ncbi:MAG TPA: hypothetical protein VK114_00960, partial [Nitrososphaerales archaeon]|nr:hypothetical protein [Nitrososphaerales archaeon]